MSRKPIPITTGRSRIPRSTHSEQRNVGWERLRNGLTSSRTSSGARCESRATSGQAAATEDRSRLQRFRLRRARCESHVQSRDLRSLQWDVTGQSLASSAASQGMSEPKGQELVYSARVSLDRTQMEVEGETISLSPGMAVTVEIKTGSAAGPHVPFVTVDEVTDRSSAFTNKVQCRHN